MADKEQKNPSENSAQTASAGGDAGQGNRGRGGSGPRGRGGKGGKKRDERRGQQRNAPHDGLHKIPQFLTSHGCAQHAKDSQKP